MSGLLPYLGSKIHYFLEKLLCLLLIFEMFNEPYLIYFPGDLSLILWEQVSYMEIDVHVLKWHNHTGMNYKDALWCHISSQSGIKYNRAFIVTLKTDLFV